MTTLNALDAYTDGSALRNPNGPGGWAWWINDDVWAAGGFKVASNQKAELWAVLALLRAVPREVPLRIHTDSAYTIGCLRDWTPSWKRNGWRTRTNKAIANLDVIRPAYEIVLSRTATTFHKVKGHSGIHGNERADQLCTAATAAIDTDGTVDAGPGWPAGVLTR